MLTEQVKLTQISINEANPRTISTGRFHKLVHSILVFPKMLELRPIVVDNILTAIGGNMRTRALTAISQMDIHGIKEELRKVKTFNEKTAGEQQVILDFWESWLDNPTAYIVKADKLSDAEKKEFIIKDNVSFGEWDMDMLANEWDMEDLEAWDVTFPHPQGDDDKDALFGHREDDKENEEEEEEDDEEEDDLEGKIDFFRMMLEDRIYPSDNEFDIPTLLLSGQPANGLLLPFAGWGTDTRAKKGIETYHFYVEDYRFTAIWKDPNFVLEGGATEFVEPNLSLFDTHPIAYGLQQIYKKRWIARYWQECGAKIYADLNVARKFQKYNIMGIPKGYNAFATRGYADRLEYLKEEIEIARQISGKEAPNMLVYGGGSEVEKICKEYNVIYVEQFMANRGSNKKGGNNG